jgi:hypothetical protein
LIPPQVESGGIPVIVTSTRQGPRVQAHVDPANGNDELDLPPSQVELVNAGITISPGVAIRDGI